MPNKTFSQKLNRLEEIVSALEGSEVELEEGLKLLEEGVALHKDCQKTLEQSQAKITELLSGSQAKGSQTSEEAANITSGSLFDELGQSQRSNEADQKDSSELPF